MLLLAVLLWLMDLLFLVLIILLIRVIGGRKLLLGIISLLPLVLFRPLKSTIRMCFNLSRIRILRLINKLLFLLSWIIHTIGPKVSSFIVKVPSKLYYYLDSSFWVLLLVILYLFIKWTEFLVHFKVFLSKSQKWSVLLKLLSNPILS